jgi:hypothetical protein
VLNKENEYYQKTAHKAFKRICLKEMKSESKKTFDQSVPFLHNGYYITRFETGKDIFMRVRKVHCNPRGCLIATEMRTFSIFSCGDVINGLPIVWTYQTAVYSYLKVLRRNIAH